MLQCGWGKDVAAAKQQNQKDTTIDRFLKRQVSSAVLEDALRAFNAHFQYLKGNRSGNKYLNSASFEIDE